MKLTDYSKRTPASRICCSSGTISLVKSPLEFQIIMPRCPNPHLYPPHGFLLLYLSSYLSRPWLLHITTLIRFLKMFLSETQLKCTKESASQKESINSLIWLLFETRGSHTRTESRSAYLQRQLNSCVDIEWLNSHALWETSPLPAGCPKRGAAWPQHI